MELGGLRKVEELPAVALPKLIASARGKTPMLGAQGRITAFHPLPHQSLCSISFSAFFTRTSFSDAHGRTAGCKRNTIM